MMMKDTNVWCLPNTFLDLSNIPSSTLTIQPKAFVNLQTNYSLSGCYEKLILRFYLLCQCINVIAKTGTVA